MPPWGLVVRQLWAVAIVLLVAFSGCAKKGNNEPATTTTTSPPPSAPLPHIHGLAMDLDGQRLHVGTHGGLYTLESDRVWTQVSQDYDFMGLIVHPSEPQTFYASGHPSTGGNAGFLKSTDGGATWTAIALGGQADFHALAISAANPARIWGYWGDLIHRTDDGGKNWNSLPPHGLGPIRALAADPADAQRLYATTEKGLHVSSDGGMSWMALFTAGGAAHALAVAPSDAQRLYYQGVGLGVARSFDKGASFKGTGWYPDRGDRVETIAVHPTEAGVLYAATFKGAIVKFVADGTEWKIIRGSGNLIS